MPRQLPLQQRLIYGAITAVAGLLALELLARQIEAWWPMPERVALPTPRGTRCVDCVTGTAGIDPGKSHQPSHLLWSEEVGTWVVRPREPMHGEETATLRGSEPLEPKQPDELRILTVGDSSVWGDGVPAQQVFGQLAARELRTTLDRPVTACNAAQPGHTAEQSLSVLRAIGARVDPDLVLVGNLWSDLFHESSPGWLQPPGRGAPSALYRLGLRVLAPLLPQRRIGWVDPERGVGTPGQGLEPRTSPEDYARALHELAAESRQLGAQPAYLLLPAPLDFAPGPPPAFITRYRQQMRTTAQEERAPLIDAVAGFEAAGAGPQHFFDSVHPSARGHELLGELVAEALEEHEERLPRRSSGAPRPAGSDRGSGDGDPGGLGHRTGH